MRFEVSTKANGQLCEALAPNIDGPCVTVYHRNRPWICIFTSIPSALTATWRLGFSIPEGDLL